jgi:ABC-type uncharacterized transport system permease subunit
VSGALSVGVIGSLLATRYSDRIGAALAPYHVHASTAHVIQGSVGAALAVLPGLPRSRRTESRPTDGGSERGDSQ